mgnify:FL=1|jgi:hypothetical protein
MSDDDESVADNGSTPGIIKYHKNAAFDVLVEEDDIFNSNFRCFIFSGMLGYYRGRKTDDLDYNAQTRWLFIAGNNDIELPIAAIAFADTGDPNVIDNPKQQVDILRQYAASGANILLDQVVQKRGNNLNNLLELINVDRDTDERVEESKMLAEIDATLTQM